MIAYLEPHLQKRNDRSRLILTEKGTATVKKMHDFTIDTVRRTSDDIPTEEIATFYRVFRTLEKRLDEHADILESRIKERKDP